MASASAEESPGGNVSPAPSTISRRPPTAEAITGRPRHLLESGQARGFFHDRRDDHGSYIAEFSLQSFAREEAGDANAGLQASGCN